MQKTLDFLNKKTGGFKPEIALVLGSGMSDFAKDIMGISVNYSEIPDFKASTVKGHKGELLFCEIEGKKCVIMQGRFHYYEGHSMQEATYPIKVFKKLGVKTLVLTNAAGSLDLAYKPSDIVILTDHINLTGDNPLIGANDESLGTRFPDMTEIYNRNLIKTAKKAAEEIELDIKEGIYAGTTGPSYETPAEVRMLRMIGAQVVGMSTVSESIVGRYCGMDVLGLSLVTNYASGLKENKLTHDEVIETAAKAGEKISKLVRKIIALID